MRAKTVIAIACFVIMVGISSASAPNSGQCAYYVNSSNTNYYAANQSCMISSLNFHYGVSDSKFYCPARRFSPGGEIIFVGNNYNDSIYGCGFSGNPVVLGRNSNINLISPTNTNFSTTFRGSNSSLTVGYWLRINLLEPHGYDSIPSFGNRTAAFSWIYPTFNGTVSAGSSQMQMGEFYNATFGGTFSRIRSSLRFGAYNGVATEIYRNITEFPYGRSVGTKTFLLPSYTIYGNRTVNYNPYAVDYSFLEYDQLDEFRLNMTRDTNITPLYIQPIHPIFNFNILPYNETGNVTISYLLAVPPQDYNWSGEAYIYRYAPPEFVLNPLYGVGPHSNFAHMLSLPSNAVPAGDQNGTLMYYMNLSQSLPLGINSSIVMAVGSIPGVGTYIQDSTTPSFSMGLGYCSTTFNNTVVQLPIKVNVSGKYGMVDRLYPLEAAAIPDTAYAPCGIGALINGRNITLDCHGGVINDTGYGIIVNGSNGVVIRNCVIRGNGIMVSNSSNVTVLNTTLSSNGTSQFAVWLHNSTNIRFSNTSLIGSFRSVFVNSSSSDVSVSDLIVCGFPQALSGCNAVRQFPTYTQSAYDGIEVVAVLAIAAACAYALRSSNTHKLRTNATRSRGRR